MKYITCTIFSRKFNYRLLIRKNIDYYTTRFHKFHNKLRNELLSCVTLDRTMLKTHSIKIDNQSLKKGLINFFKIN